jgi:phage terminase large subunit-like protein
MSTSLTEQSKSFHVSSLDDVPQSRLDEIISSLSKEPDAEAKITKLMRTWESFARLEQLPLPQPWQVWMFLAGRGAGKTRSGAEWIRDNVKQGVRRIGLIAPTAADARDVMIEGSSGIMGVCWEYDRDVNNRPLGKPLYEPSKRRVTWLNGAMATAFSAEGPERLRGPQHELLWCDELAAWQYAQDCWDMAMFGLRIGAHPRVMVTTTPKPIPVVRELMRSSNCIVTRATTYANLLCSWEPLSGDESPDRLDALVWALTELFLRGGEPLKMVPAYVAGRPRNIHRGSDDQQLRCPRS